MDRERAVLRQLAHHLLRLVVTHGNTGVEVDAVSAGDRHTADDIIRGSNL